jgi:hypothetical protein
MIDLENRFPEFASQLKDLPALKDGVSDVDIEALSDIYLLWKNAKNPEVEEAFKLIVIDGIYQKIGVRYQVPKYNTELEILFWLAEQNEFKQDDTLALAIAMVNGLYVSLGNDEVKNAVNKDVNDLLVFFRETDDWQKERQIYQLEDYPIEAKIALAWLGNDLGRGGHMHYKLISGGYSSKNPINIHSFLMNQYKPINLADYKWQTVDIETLRKMREFLYQNKMIYRDVSFFVSELEEYLYFSGARNHWVFTEPNDKMIDVDNEKTVNHNMNNADFEFQNLLKCGWGIGVCDDEMVLVDAFLKSCGIPSIAMVRTYGKKDGSNHTHILYYEHKSNTWKAYLKQINVGLSLNWNVYIFKPPIKRYNYFKDHQDSNQLYIKLLNTYYRILKADGWEISKMIISGIPTSEMKQWFLYSDTP